MSRLATWVALTTAIVSYRLIFNTSTSLEEHVAAVYFSGIALFMHWLTAKEKGRL